MIIRIHLSFLLLIVTMLTACAGEPVSTPAPASLSAPVTELPAPPDPVIPTPPATADEELLTGPGEGTPDVYVPLAPISKAELAAFLKTTPSQLDRLNPGLPDPVPADTLLTVPLDYITDGSETLASVAAATGLDEAILHQANRSLDPQTPLPPDTRLRMPRLFVVYRPTPLDDIAELLAKTPEDLRTFNPELAGTETVAAGTVLVVPFQ
ncbi:MAG: hypothetical protein KF753_02730 [Caldilineaceae bacterium]|nr:hypothetical protein [Caldilineaceae bacterium]